MYIYLILHSGDIYILGVTSYVNNIHYVIHYIPRVHLPVYHIPVLQLSMV